MSFAPMNSGHANFSRWYIRLVAAAICSALCGCSRPASQAQKILGCPLPPSATDIRVACQTGKLYRLDWLSAAMSHDDYTALVARLGLTHHDDIVLNLWPGALTKTEMVRKGKDVPWWTVTRTNDTETFFYSYEGNSKFVPNSPYTTNIAAR